MSRLALILPLVALSLAQDTGLYISKVPIHGKQSATGQKYTFFVDDNYDADQLAYATDIASAGSLYEDDYSPDTASCQSTECPLLRKLYAYVNKAGSTITYTRIIDASMKTATVTGKVMGYVAPYPGYCTSDDSTPIIELYSETLNTYAYWSPANPNQYVTLSNTVLDRSRWVPVRLVGYALPASPARLVLQNTAPDFKKNIGKANYTHSFLPAVELVQLSGDGNKWQVLAKMSTIDTQIANNGMKYAGSLKVFLLAPNLAGEEVRAVELLCGTRIILWAAGNADRSSIRLFPTTGSVPTGYSAMSLAGGAFAKSSAVCGGIKGMGKLTEFQNKANPNRFTYAVEPSEITSLTNSGQWTPTNVELGYLSRDTNGFQLFNGVLTSPKL